MDITDKFNVLLQYCVKSNSKLGHVIDCMENLKKEFNIEGNGEWGELIKQLSVNSCSMCGRITNLESGICKNCSFTLEKEKFSDFKTNYDREVALVKKEKEETEKERTELVNQQNALQEDYIRRLRELELEFAEKEHNIFNREDEGEESSVLFRYLNKLLNDTSLRIAQTAEKAIIDDDDDITDYTNLTREKIHLDDLKREIDLYYIQWLANDTPEKIKELHNVTFEIEHEIEDLKQQFDTSWNNEEIGEQIQNKRKAKDDIINLIQEKQELFDVQTKNLLQAIVSLNRNVMLEADISMRQYPQFALDMMPLKNFIRSGDMQELINKIHERTHPEPTITLGFIPPEEFYYEDEE